MRSGDAFGSKAFLGGWLRAEHLDHIQDRNLPHGGVVEVVPKTSFQVLDVGIVMATECRSRVDHDCVEVVDEVALSEVLLLQLRALGLNLSQ